MTLRALLVWMRALRVKQWTKNLVVLAAFIFALGDRTQQVPVDLFLNALEAALLFCLASSGIYLLNDLHDLRQDRAHPVKRLRPLAAGELSPQAAGVAAVILLTAAMAGARAVSPAFAVVVGGYLLLQVVYTYALKQIALVDLFVIATGFVLRALAGAVALGVEISPWLLICTLLLALFLALCKRRHEKVVEGEYASESRPMLRNYNSQLLDQLIAIVSAATLVSYSLYTLWPDTVEKFGTRGMGFTIPFVIFGLFRYLDLVYRHEKGGRPEQILLTDPPLLIDIALYGATVIVIQLLA